MPDPVLSAHAWIAIGTSLGVLAALASNRFPADLVMLAAVGVLFATGTLDTKQALGGFANEGVLTVAILFVVAAAMQRSGAMALLTRPLLRKVGGPRTAILRLALPVAGLSGFLNNTPLVAMLLPAVADWGRRCGISPSKLLIPLSYATILGGMLTMIGTSTNLVVAGLLVQSGHPAPGLLWPLLLALPVIAIGIATLVLAGPRLLPDRVRIDAGAFGDPRQYTTTLAIEAGGPFDGQTLRSVKTALGVLPVEVQRDGDTIPAPGPDLVVHASDRLLIAGPARQVLAANRTVGLSPAGPDTHGPSEPGRRRLYEVVVSDRCPLVGQPMGSGAFRARYAAAILAIARHGQRLADSQAWVLRPGDTLLVEARSAFAEDPAHQRDFWVATERTDPAGPRRPAWLATAVLAAMCAAAATGVLPMLWAALAAGLVVVGIRLLPVDEARSSIDLQVIATIACALALGRALEVSGAAQHIAGWLVGFGGSSPWLTLALVYAATALATELITNNAAAALLFPIGMAAAAQLGVAWEPFALAVMFAASASFATPIGYQTNLMVWGPGGYRFGDFLRLGLLLQVIVGVATVLLLPLLHPFR